MYLDDRREDEASEATEARLGSIRCSLGAAVLLARKISCAPLVSLAGKRDIAPTLSEYRYADGSSTKLLRRLLGALLKGVVVRDVLVLAPCERETAALVDLRDGAAKPETTWTGEARIAEADRDLDGDTGLDFDLLEDGSAVEGLLEALLATALVEA